MDIIPRSIQKLIKEFTKFPGVGEKSATRFVYHLLRQNPEKLAYLSSLIAHVHEAVQECIVCHRFGTDSPCDICTSSERTRHELCVVEKDQDIYSIERAAIYKGTYFVLGGVISPIDGITPDKLRVEELVRLLHNRSEVSEILLAINPSVEGEATMLYLKRRMAELPHITLSRLARGLPLGAEIEYADHLTISEAINGRKPV